MNFNDWSRESRKCIVQAPGVMREGAGIDNDGVNSSTSAMNCIDELTLVIGLKIFKSETSLACPIRNTCNVIGERRCSINLRFALT